MFRHAFVLSLFIMSVLFGGVSIAADIQSYSADMETVTPKGTYTSKVYLKNSKKRMEMTMRGETTISIIRLDKKISWMLMPSEKVYIEMPLNMGRQDVADMINDPDLKPEKEFLGNETVDGHPTKKYRITMSRGSKRDKSGYIWEAADLNNFVIKYQNEDKSHTITWKNIRTTGISDSLFEVPSGYTKMDMPFPGGAGSMRGPNR